MVITSNPSKPFVFTPKGAVRRRAVLELYKKEIESLYEALQRGFQHEVEPLVSWTVSSCQSFIRTIVNGVLKRGVGDHDNIFEMGCDRSFKFLVFWMLFADQREWAACKRRGSGIPFCIA